MSFLDILGRRLFDTEVLEEKTPSGYYPTDKVPSMSAKTRRRRLEPTLVVMSRETERELYREDVNGMNYTINPVKGEPCRVFGIRIANDDSLSLGQFLVAEKLY